MGELHEELQGFVGDVIGEATVEVESILDDTRLMLPSLETFVRSMDKIMDSANKIKTAAEKSDYGVLAMANAIRAHERQMGLLYGNFTKSRSMFEKIAKKVDIPLRGAKGASRKGSVKVDPKGMTPDQLEADITRLYNGLQGVINGTANDGAFFLKEIRKLAAKKAPAYDTVRGEVAALVQDFLKFRGGVYKFFGMLEGIVKRMNIRAKAVGDISMSRYKPSKAKKKKAPAKRKAAPKRTPKSKSKRKKATPEDLEQMVGIAIKESAEEMFEATHNRPPADPVELLEFAANREHKRGMGFFERG